MSWQTMLVPDIRLKFELGRLNTRSNFSLSADSQQQQWCSKFCYTGMFYSRFHLENMNFSVMRIVACQEYFCLLMVANPPKYHTNNNYVVSEKHNSSPRRQCWMKQKPIDSSCRGDRMDQFWVKIVYLFDFMATCSWQMSTSVLDQLSDQPPPIHNLASHNYPVHTKNFDRNTQNE